jgi:hypothetical protein
MATAEAELATEVDAEAELPAAPVPTSVSTSTLIDSNGNTKMPFSCTATVCNTPTYGQLFDARDWPAALISVRSGRLLLCVILPLLSV